MVTSFPDAVGTVAPGDDPEFMAAAAASAFVVLDDMQLDPPVASAEIEGSWATACDAVVEVELGRDIGSSVFGSGNVAPSSMTDRIGGRAGDGVRVGTGAANGARLFACENASVEAVMVTVANLERTRDSEQWVDRRDEKAVGVVDLQATW
ncbi:uncharacterized protein PG986_005312 [Apiospora aurea]|uniref:Uncharacterized protein n=1 Tax=Apiospora aurea TaxID=335848 RepID=A0ABR1QH67_9PEZI